MPSYASIFFLVLTGTFLRIYSTLVNAYTLFIGEYKESCLTDQVVHFYEHSHTCINSQAYLVTLLMLIMSLLGIEYFNRLPTGILNVECLNPVIIDTKTCTIVLGNNSHTLICLKEAATVALREAFSSHNIHYLSC